MRFDERKWGMTLEEAAKQLDEELCVVEGGKVRCCVGLRATLYFWKGADPEVRKRLLRVFERYLKEAAGKLRWGADPVTMKPKKLAGTTVADPRAWLQHLDAEEWSLVFHGAEKRDDASPWSFVALAEETVGALSYVTFTLPLSWLQGRGPAGFAKLVAECCDLVRPYHGYAGLSTIQHVRESGETPAMLHIQALAFRFRGLEVDFPKFHSMYLEHAIKGVNWLTVLADEWLEKLGGRRELEQALGEEFVFHAYPGGVVIQAGPRPLFGDVNRNEDLPLYRKLARALKPIRVEYADTLGQAAFETVEKTRAWFDRFDQEG